MFGPSRNILRYRLSHILLYYLQYLLMSVAAGKGDQDDRQPFSPCSCITNALNQMQVAGCFLCGNPKAPSGGEIMYRAYDFYVGFAFRCEGCDMDVRGKFTVPICTHCFEPLEISIFRTEAEEDIIEKQVKEKLQMLIPGVALA